MSSQSNLKLTPEQTALIPVYRQKWWKSALSHKRLDRERTQKAIATAYSLLSLPSPEIVFFDSPQAAVEFWERQPKSSLERYGLPVSQFYSIILKLFFQLPKLAIDSLPLSVWEELQQGNFDRLGIWREVGDKYLPRAFILSSTQGEIISRQLSQLDWGKKWIWEISKIGIKAFPNLAEPIVEFLWQEQQKAMREQLLQQPGGNWLVQIGDTVGSWLQPLEKPVRDFVVPSITKGLGDSLVNFGEYLSQSSSVTMTGSSLSGNSIFLGVELLPILDFWISEIEELTDGKSWEAIKTLTQETCWVMPCEQVCFVFERPIKLLFDDRDRLHAEGQPALKFADGYRVYAYQGVTLPEKYGKLHPHQWQSAWILEERNAELRRVLIQGIGYGRLCQELNATILDSWREYTLLRINLDRVAYVNEQEVIEEPIHLLKMTCPSTNHIHVLRVPPDLTSARAAVSWVNHDVDPETFAQET
jgi:hypothetical protein